jgi:hypothetical protein
VALLGRVAARSAEQYHLSDTRADGPMLGYCAGHPIFSAIVDGFGQRYVFAGVAVRRWDGDVDVAALRPGEWLLEPGLIYRSDRAARWWPWQFRRLRPA